MTGSLVKEHEFVEGSASGSMTDAKPTDPPSPFVSLWARRLRAGWPGRPRALDVACGRGRHTLVLAGLGYRVTAIDVRIDALRSLGSALAEGGLRAGLVCADLTQFALPADAFDLIIVSRYLDRARLPDLRRALAPAGVLLYETFTERQLQHARGPRSRAHLLRPGELRHRVRGLEVLFDEEATEPDAVARVVARRRHAIQK